MHHSGVEFEIVEVSRFRWRWTIYPKKNSLRDGKVSREVTAKTREQVVAYCKREIDRKIQRQMNFQGS